MREEPKDNDELELENNPIFKGHNAIEITLIKVLAISWGIFQIYTAAKGTLAPLQQRGTYLFFTLILAFLIHDYGTPKSWVRKISYLLLIISIPVSVYPIIQSRHIMYTPGIYTKFEIIISILAIPIILEACRRTTGWSIPIVSFCFLLYAAIGHFLGPPWGHKFYPIDHIASVVYFSLEGVFGIALAVATNYVFMFILFGAFYQMSGGSELIVGLAKALMGQVRGGPAKIAVAGSCLFGSISGAGVANVAATGSITIPLMKRVGYKARFAAAVEAAASSGGQIMPPVMGGAAFVMADILGVPYWRIVVAAFLPALLYYWAVFESVDFEAGKNKLKGMSHEEIPDIKNVLKESWPSFIPLFLIIYFLAVFKQSPQRASLMGVAACSVIIFFRHKGNLKSKILKLIDVLEKGSLRAVIVSSAAACVGIIVGVIMMSGIGFKMGSMLADLSRGNVWILLFLAMISSLILGMGLPVTVSYLIVVFIVIRPLLEFGILPLIAHMFALFFAVMSNVTPPFAMAAVTAAGMAGSNPMKTGVLAFSFLIPSFVVAYSFVTRPELLLIGGSWPIAITYFLLTAIGITCFAASRAGYFIQEINWVERIILLILAFPLLFSNNLYVLAVVVGFFIVFFIFQYIKKRDSLVIKNNN